MQRARTTKAGVATPVQRAETFHSGSACDGGLVSNFAGLIAPPQNAADAAAVGDAWAASQHALVGFHLGRAIRHTKLGYETRIRNSMWVFRGTLVS
jgi:hypothetical protein